MARERRLSTPPLLVGGIGATLFVVAVVHHATEFAAIAGIGPIVALLLDLPPAAALVYGGYWLDRTELDDAHQWLVSRWSITGVVLVILVIGATFLIRFVEGRPVSEPLFPLLIAAEAGGLAGFIAGYYNARARLEAERATRANEELVTLNQQLEASNERLEQFAYTASHDLQEPLRMISSYLRLLDDRYGDDLDEEAQEFMEYAVDGAERMSSMIESLLEYSRVTTRGNPLEPTDVQPIVEDVLEDLQLRIEETDATITTDDLPTVRADADQLARVFQNLISNAIRHSGDDPPRIHIGAERTDDVWVFSVRDEGVGIDPDYQDKIFDLFEQLDPDADSGGTAGMGLALCERIIDRHEGDIWVESEPGEGTSFYFTLQPVSTGEES